MDFATTLRSTTTTLKQPPRWFRGSLQRAYGVALDEWQRSRSAGSWMLLLLTPRLLLTPTRSKGAEGRQELTRRLERFLAGDWVALLEETTRNDGAQPRPGRTNHSDDADDSRARKLEAACKCVRLNEVSRARQLLTITGLAPGNETTRQQLTDPAKRPPTLTRLIPAEMLSDVPPSAFQLDLDKLKETLSTARKGRAADLFGTRLEHLRVLLDSGHWDAFAAMAKAFTNADVPPSVLELMRQGRMTALKKRDGRARGIVTGCAFRRLVSKAVAKQCAGLFRDATAPFQFALQTRAGLDAVALSIRAMCDADPDLVVLSLDGIGAFDHVRRAAFLQELRDQAHLRGLLPMVRALYTTPSTYLWADDAGTTHSVQQGEGGEQGDPLMPALYALGQHRALVQANEQLQADELLLAYLDDLYVLCHRSRAAEVFRVVSGCVAEHAGVQAHLGKLRAWCSGGGEAPPDLAALGSEVWTANLPPAQNGLMVLGVPVGTPEFIAACGSERLDEERILLEQLPELPDTQCAWLLLALSAVPRANHLLRTTPPSLVESYAQQHDEALWTTLNRILGTEAEAATDGGALSRDLATLPARHGGLGLRSAARTSTAAYWAAWVDALGVLRTKNPNLATRFLNLLERPLEEQPRCLQEATTARAILRDRGYTTLPTWREAVAGAEAPQPTDAEMGEWSHG